MKTRPLKILAASLLLNLAIMILPSRAAPGDVDPSFDPGSGIDGSVSSIAVQSDGKVIIAGGFRTVNGLVRRRIARLNADGSGDASFTPDPGVTGSPANQTDPAVFLQPDGKILVAAAPSNGTSRSLLVRLNPDGTHDVTFAAATGGHIQSVALQPDGKLVVIGSLTTDGTNSFIAARLHSDGSLDNSFTPATGIYLTRGATVNSVALQPDGKVLIGGYLTSINGTAREGIARLNANGSVDTTFNPDPSSVIRRSVRSIVVLTDGKILFGGYSRLVADNTIENVVRLHANGSVDSSFNSDATSWGSDVESIALQPDGKLVVGGGYDNIIRLNANGSRDPTFDPGTGPDGQVLAVALQPDGKVLIGGRFNKVDGKLVPGLARLNANGSLESSFNPDAGISSDVNERVVYALASQADGKVVIAGIFNTVGGASRNGVARLNADGSLDNSFNPGTGANDSILALAVQPDGRMIIGGDFTMVDGIARNLVARLNADGTLDSGFNPGAGPDGVVFAVALQPDGKLFIGGWFTTVNGVARNKIARLNSDGSLDTTFGTGTLVTGHVYSIAVQPDGKVLRGGQYLARLHTDGRLDATFDPNMSVNNSIESVVWQPDGKVLIGGYFSTINGMAHTGLARVQADGILDSGFNPGTIAGGDLENGSTSVNAMTLQPDGKLLIGGSFTSVGETDRDSLARLNRDGSADPSFNPGNGADGGLVYSMALQPDGKVLIGGDFTSVNGVACWRVARLLGDTVVPPLDIALSNGFAVLSWPAPAIGYELQEPPDLTVSASWIAVTQTAVTSGGGISVTIPITGPQKYFRLISP